MFNIIAMLFAASLVSINLATWSDDKWLSFKVTTIKVVLLTVLVSVLLSGPYTDMLVLKISFILLLCFGYFVMDFLLKAIHYNTKIANWNRWKILLFVVEIISACASMYYAAVITSWVLP